MTAFFAVLSVLALASLGLVTLVNNPKSKGNRFFFAFCISLGLWVASNYLADADVARSLFWTRLAFSSVVAATASFGLFVGIFPRQTPNFTRRYQVILSAATIMTFITWLEAFIPDVKFVDNVSTVMTGSLYPTFIGYFIVITGFSIFTLVRHSFSLRGLDRARVRLILEGLLFVVIIGSILDLFLPLVVGNNDLAPYGTYSTVVFAGVIYLAIFRHRLFDIRAIVARSVAYLLVIGSLGAIFSVVLLGITNLLDKNESISLGLKAIYLFLALMMTAAFQPLKRIFDRLSNSIFYRDAYDPQELLDKLNSSLVSTIDIEELLKLSSSVIKEGLKVEFCTFVIHGTNTRAPRLVGTGKYQLTKEEADGIKEHSRTSGEILITDEMASSTSKLKELLQQASIGALVKLKGTSAVQAPSPGFMLLGQKSSGSIYSSQDAKIIGILADELVIAIQNSLRFEEISQFNITLRQKIEEATRELRSANKRLRDLDAAKDEFISMASHQLRTPLTSVKGYLSMALDGDAGKLKMEQAELLQHAFDSAQRMVYLISDLLNVSRLQTGKFVIENKPTNLAEVVVGEMDQLKDQAANREITMEYVKPDKFPVLNLDETKIRQVIMNFLDNALYYTPKGGHVKIVVSASPHTVELTVTDSGIGVPKSAQHQLFGKFYRADNAKVARPDGTGLGLFMAKKVIVAQGGAIIFRSTEGKGSTFGFSLPRKSLELNAA